MTVREATIILVKRYQNMLQAFNQGGGKPPHELLMCNTLLQNSLWPIDKMSRWLGFIQGYVISKGYTTVQAERDYSRPLFHEAYKTEGIEIPETLEGLEQHGHSHENH